LQTNKNHILRETTAIGGYKWIYEDLLRRLADADIATSAQHLGLAINDAEEVDVAFLGATYLISKRGARRTDGKRPSYATGSALIHYILKGSRSRPNGQFVRLLCRSCRSRFIRISVPDFPIQTRASDRSNFFKIQLNFIKKMAYLMMTDLPLLFSDLAVMPLFQPVSMAIMCR
jgi:hypothetical protein